LVLDGGDTGATRTKAATELLYARQAVLTHAKAFGLQAIDLVNINYKDLDHLRQESREGAQMGFTGKQIIHPNQVAIVQEEFAPSPERIQYALELEEAFNSHQESGAGAFTFRDQMIDMPTMIQCQNVLALARKVGLAPPKPEPTPIDSEA
jgi:citrate lyase subunit beta-like protein